MYVNEVKIVPSSQLRKGDLFLCEAGDIIPADAEVIEGVASVNESAITVPGYSMEGWYGRIYRGCGFFDPDKPIKKYTKKELNDLLYKEPTKIKVEGINLTYTGLIPQIQKSFLAKDVDAMQPHIRAFVERAITFTTCPECDGTRLSEGARSSKIKGVNIADACSMRCCPNCCARQQPGSPRT